MSGALAAIDRLILDQRAEWGVPYDDLVQARALVAELIEADKEYDATNLALQTLDAIEFRSDEKYDAAYGALCDRLDVARDRRAAALARVTGGA